MRRMSCAARRGTFVAAPIGVVHTFANETSEEATFLNIHAPNAGFADMLRARHDSRHEEADRFDQHPPPADGGKPLSEAIVVLRPARARLSPGSTATSSSRLRPRRYPR